MIACCARSAPRPLGRHDAAEIEIARTEQIPAARDAYRETIRAVIGARHQVRTALGDVIRMCAV